MKIIRKILPLISAVISLVMFFISKDDYGVNYPQEFKGVYFSLVIFSTFYFYLQIRNVRFPLEDWKCKLIVSLCSFWLFINQIYIWLRTNTWSVGYNVYSIFLIIAFGAFVFIYIQDLYCEKMNFAFQKIVGVTAPLLLIIGSAWACVWGYYDQAIICVCALLLALTDFISINSDRMIIANGGDKE